MTLQAPSPTLAHPDLGQQGLHVWHLDLDRPGPIARAVALDACLSAAELRRHTDLTDPGAKALALLARGGLRHVLGRYLGMAPADLQFGTIANGKPVLAGPARAAGLHFNLSHSGTRVAIAVSSAAAVGVDIEHIRPSSHLAKVARRFFAQEEAASLAVLSGQDLTTAFFRIWTLKEAFIKMTGRGLAQPLHNFAVSAGPPARLLRCTDTPEAANWHYDCRPIAESYICSVVCAQGLARAAHFNG